MHDVEVEMMLTSSDKDFTEETEGLSNQSFSNIPHRFLHRNVIMYL
jgi:hypothetical protein